MDSLRNVECEIEIQVSPTRVISAFTDPELLKGWWGVERSFIELAKGGQYTLAWGISEQGIKYISTGVIADYDPSGLLHIDKYMYLNPERPFLGPLQLMINATPIESGSNLYLCQGPYPEGAGPDWDWYYEAVVVAWPKVLQTLKSFLEGKSV
jgi:uncharacterized protein YndB with AHSA1/START domain